MQLTVKGLLSHVLARLAATAPAFNVTNCPRPYYRDRNCPVRKLRPSCERVASDVAHAIERMRNWLNVASLLPYATIAMLGTPSRKFLLSEGAGVNLHVRNERDEGQGKRHHGLGSDRRPGSA